MIYTIEELRHEVLDKAEEVYGIFRDFFGDDFVDLQVGNRTLHNEDFLPSGVTMDTLSTSDIPNEHIEVMKNMLASTLSIVVWWPEVTGINTLGTIPYEQPGFLLKRATYNMTQLTCGYLHSHIPHASIGASLADWKSPCLGRGPIRGTIMSLKSDYNDTMWMLFCQELSMYVTVESLTGVPYKRLEDVGAVNENASYNDYHFMRMNNRELFGLPKPSDMSCEAYADWLRRFTEYYLRHNHLSIGYNSKEFEINMPFFNFIIDISNACIEFLNLTSNQQEVANFFTGEVLLKARISGTTISTQARRSRTDISNVVGMDILTFKDAVRTLRVFEDTSSADQSETVLFDCQVAQYILKNILKVINYRYKNEHTNRRQESSAQTYQRVLYL